MNEFNGGNGPRNLDEIPDLRDFLDPDHPLSTISDGERILVSSGKVLKSIRRVMEEVGADSASPVGVGDIATFEALESLVDSGMGPELCAHVVTTGLRILLERFPADLVEKPLPPELDLRELSRLDLTDRQHELARSAFDRRSAPADDIISGVLTRELAEFDSVDVIYVFIALFRTYRLKMSSLSSAAGIE